MTWEVLDLALWIITYEIQLCLQITTFKNNSLINKEKKLKKQLTK